jgi:hypothetical protein
MRMLRHTARFLYHSLFAPTYHMQIRLLRSMLEWGRELGASIAAESALAEEAANGNDAAAIAAWTEKQLAPRPRDGAGASADVMVLVWPGGRILRVPRGTTAGAVQEIEKAAVVVLHAGGLNRLLPLQHAPQLWPMPVAAGDGAVASLVAICCGVNGHSASIHGRHGPRLSVHTPCSSLDPFSPVPAGSVIRDLGLIEISPSSPPPSSSSDPGSNVTLPVGASPRDRAAAAAAVGQAAAQHAQRARRQREQQQQLVNVNNRLVPEETPLFDGDYVVLSRDKVRI